MPKLATPEDLRQLHARLSPPPGQKTIAVCWGPGCQALRSQPVITALEAELARRGLTDQVRLRATGCQGFCEQGPVLVIEPEDWFYCRVTPDDAADIVSSLQRGEPVARLLYTDPASGKTLTRESEIPFYALQDRTLLSLNRQVDPRAIEDYLALGGYSTLSDVLTNGWTPERVIREVIVSGLRGRGGGGYPTGRKWASCRAAHGEEKYVICNADEGDPGAYMDRALLEGNPHLVLEGMLLGAWAIGASQGYIYVRREYPLAVEHARLAVQQARDYGLLGRDILGSGFDFDLEIARGGGAFVCGESTALMASLEGKVGEPRPKDVHTVEEGLWDKPTCLNNVETWANVPLILKGGAARFAAKGTKRSKGTKIFALTGQVRNTGLVEVPMGISLRALVFGIGGGPRNGVAIKAVQTGGPSGGCLPVSEFDLPVDFESLSEAGSMVGSGGLVVLDERSCMVDVARYFLAFLQEESCGKCVPCRIGIDRMLEILTDITEGRGRPEQLDLLEDLADTVQATSLCALGKSAPNPVLSTLRYFRDEYLAHLTDRRCPAGVCRALITYAVDTARCQGCGACLRACPHAAIAGEKKQPHTIDPARCQRCGLCAAVCPADAITTS